MCKLIDISKVKTYDDIQLIIMKNILQKRETFDYSEIVNAIRQELIEKDADEKKVYSFRVDCMIRNTLESLVRRERLYCFNYEYTPIVPNKMYAMG